MVCSEWDIGPIGEQLIAKDEVVLDVSSFKNHPDFSLGQGLSHDISVHSVIDSKLSQPGILRRRKLYPACLPSILHKSKDGLFAGWREPADLGEFYIENAPDDLINTVDQHREKELILRRTRVKNTTCKDPEWMKMDTYYPKGKLIHILISNHKCMSKVHFMHRILPWHLVLTQEIRVVG